MANFSKAVIAGFALCAVVSVAGCGGGSEGETYPSKTLSWTSPSTYSDGTPLNPTTELDSFEVYVENGGSFSDSDSPMAVVAAYDPTTGRVTTAFDLANLGPYLSKGVPYHVSLRAVSRTGQRSAFSSSVSFSF